MQHDSIERLGEAFLSLSFIGIMLWSLLPLV
jgi:hypothetical protein